MSADDIQSYLHLLESLNSQQVFSSSTGFLCSPLPSRRRHDLVPAFCLKIRCCCLAGNELYRCAGTLPIHLHRTTTQNRCSRLLKDELSAARPAPPSAARRRSDNHPAFRLIKGQECRLLSWWPSDPDVSEAGYDLLAASRMWTRESQH